MNKGKTVIIARKVRLKIIINGYQGIITPYVINAGLVHHSMIIGRDYMKDNNHSVIDISSSKDAVITIVDTDMDSCIQTTIPSCEMRALFSLAKNEFKRLSISELEVNNLIEAPRQDR